MKKLRKPIVALTGGIASGKSLITKLLADLGNCTVVNADLLAHQVMAPGGSAYKDIVNFFGEGILEDKVDANGNRAIDRNKLRALVFQESTDSAKLKRKLEDFTHPRILEAAYQEFAKADKDYILWEVPLLYETKLYQEADKVITITCSRLTQLKRAQSRNPNLNAEVLEQILAKQASNQQRESIANYIVINDDNLSIDDLSQKARSLNKQILADLDGKKYFDTKDLDKGFNSQNLKTRVELVNSPLIF